MIFFSINVVIVSGLFACFGVVLLVYFLVYLYVWLLLLLFHAAGVREG